MEMTITKQEFEEVVPVGTTPNDEVFEMVQPAIRETIERLKVMMLGEEGETLVENKGNVRQHFKRLVCVRAFLSVFRHLDLVLTGSGFGVVSDSNLSPASKERVNALYGDMLTQEIVERAFLVRTLCSEEWGETLQAADNIPYVFSPLDFFRAGANMTHEDWKKAQIQLSAIDGKLREFVGNELMDDMLSAIRRNDAQKKHAYKPLLFRMIFFFRSWINNGDRRALLYPYRELMRVLENPDYREVFSLYYSSTAYKNNHHTGYENTKDSPAFLF